MDYDKLIDDLRVACAGNQYNIMGVAATALSTLQAENEMLRAELEQVKRERDAAVSDIETIMAYGGGTCQFCGNGHCYARGGKKPCLPKWRGRKAE